MKLLVLFSIFFPIASGLCLLLKLLGKEKREFEVELLNKIVMIVLTLSVIAAVMFAISASEGMRMELFEIVKGIPVLLKVDGISRLFVIVFSIVWETCMFYAFGYMNNEENKQRFYGFYLIVYGVLVGLCFSGNLITMYLFFELMSLTSMPMVLHSGTHEAVMAALKYLFYSMFGAYCGLFGIFVYSKYCATLEFVAGGSLVASNAVVLVATILCIIGFGVKAGMFPMHAWLPTAHPLAPTPASAVLSSIIVKCGVLSIVRVIFYVVGATYIRGTYVQYVWMILSLITVFMGSMLAFKTKLFKKRLAYSTVSQVSYILFGLSTLTTAGFIGAMLHVVFHAFIKAGLFMSAGSFIVATGKKNADDYVAIGKSMPKTVWAYTIVSLALVGIPPLSGFVSKWYLAEGALTSNYYLVGVVGVAVLLVSALLTAGYLVPIFTKGFLPGKDVKPQDGVKETGASMWAPIAAMAVLTIVLGIFPNGLVNFIQTILGGIL